MKTKKFLTQTCLVLFSLIAFALLSFTLAPISNPPPVVSILDTQIDNGTDCYEVSDYVSHDENGCIYSVTVPFLITNLDYNPLTNDPVLPSGVEPIYLLFSIGSQDIMVPVNDFESNEESYAGASVPVFISHVTIPIDIGNVCNLNDDGVSNEDGESNDDGVSINQQTGCTEVSYEMSVVTENEAPYPFELYNGPSDIFSCYFFCGSCPIPPYDDEGGTTNTPPFCMAPETTGPWTGIFIPPCNSCEDIDAEINNESNFSNNQQGLEIDVLRSNNAINLSISPNPFNNVVSINFEAKQEEFVTLVVFDISGKMVYNSEINASKGFNQLELITGKWSPGIYYGQIRSAQRTEFFKMIKSE